MRLPDSEAVDHQEQRAAEAGHIRLSFPDSERDQQNAQHFADQQAEQPDAGRHRPPEQMDRVGQMEDGKPSRQDQPVAVRLRAAVRRFVELLFRQRRGGGGSGPVTSRNRPQDIQLLLHHADRLLEQRELLPGDFRLRLMGETVADGADIGQQLDHFRGELAAQ